jgi:hypothetical protein
MPRYLVKEGSEMLQEAHKVKTLISERIDDAGKV